MLFRRIQLAVFSLVLCATVCQTDLRVVPWKKLVPARRLNHPNDHSLGSHGKEIRQSLNGTIYAAWKMFKTNFGRVFAHPLEELRRFEIFAVNFVRIHLHNRKFKWGKATYTMKLNEFSDRTKEELKHMRCILPRAALQPGSKHVPSMTADLPKSIDWREYGAVTPVKNQGHCGSCWAFSTTGAIEGQYYQAKRQLLSFSEQQLVDCSADFGNNGCDGGLMDNAFKYIHESHGLNTEDEYPYVSGNTSKANPFCYFNKSSPHVRVTGYVDVQQFDSDMLMDALANKGPVSIAINAAETFQFYHTGVYSDEDCAGDPENLNHGVLLVGYGEEDGKPYWLVKNSWGPAWGESGYIKILRDSSNMCGVATQPSYPIVQPSAF